MEAASSLVQMGSLSKMEKEAPSPGRALCPAASSPDRIESAVAF